jgi:TolA-binding protein
VLLQGTNWVSRNVRKQLMDERQALMQQLLQGLKQVEEQCAGLQSTVDQMVQHNSQQAQLQSDLQQQQEERWVRVLMAIDELTRYVQRQPVEAPAARQQPAGVSAAPALYTPHHIPVQPLTSRIAPHPAPRPPVQHVPCNTTAACTTRPDGGVPWPCITGRPASGARR